MASVRIQRSASDTGSDTIESDWWNAPGLGIWHPNPALPGGGTLDNQASTSVDADHVTFNAVRAYVINTTANAYDDLVVQFYAGKFGLSGTYFPTLSGAKELRSIAPGQTLAIDHAWAGPLASEIADPTVHVCLAANCYLQTAGEPPSDGAPQPSPPVWNILGNPHHAQRNLTWVPGTVKDLWVGNRGDDLRRFTVEVVEDTSPQLPPEQREFLQTDPAFQALTTQFGSEPRLWPEPDSGVALAAPDAGADGSRIELDIDPGSDALVTLAFEPSGSDHPILRRFRVVQRDATGKLLDGAVVLAVDLPPGSHHGPPRSVVSAPEAR